MQNMNLPICRALLQRRFPEFGDAGLWFPVLNGGECSGGASGSGWRNPAGLVMKGSIRDPEAGYEFEAS
jgi:hypothetical protein